MAHALGHERGLEVDIRHRAVVVERLRELERALDVLARGLEVTLAAVAARAPAEDLRAKQVAGKAGALRELQRLAEQRDGRRDARQVVAAHGHPEEDLCPVDVREAGAFVDRPAALQELESRLELASLHPRPRLGREARASSSIAPVARTAVREFSSSSTASSYRCAFASASARASIASTRLRSSAETPLLEEAGVDAELGSEPLDRLARGTGLAALDLADVLLREALAREIGLGQARRHSQLTHALAQAGARGGRASTVAGGIHAA